MPDSHYCTASDCMSLLAPPRKASPLGGRYAMVPAKSASRFPEKHGHPFTRVQPPSRGPTLPRTSGKTMRYGIISHFRSLIGVNERFRCVYLSVHTLWPFKLMADGYRNSFQAQKPQRTREKTLPSSWTCRCRTPRSPPLATNSTFLRSFIPLMYPERDSGKRWRLPPPNCRSLPSLFAASGAYPLN